MSNDLDQVLAAHVASISRRDLDAYLATVHDAVSLILPTGTLLRGREEVGKFHADWFSDPDWTFSATVVGREVVGDTAVILCDVDYRDVDSAGEPVAMRYRLSLVFVRQPAGWLLLHDQNTIC